MFHACKKFGNLEYKLGSNGVNLTNYGSVHQANIKNLNEMLAT